MFARFSLKAKLQGLCLLLTAFTVCSGLLAFLSLQRISGHYHHVAHTNLVRTQSALEILARYRQMRIDTAQMSVVGIPKEVSDASEADLYDFQKRGDQAFLDYQSVDYSAGEKFAPKEKELFEGLEKRWTEFKDRKEGLVKAIKAGDRKIVDHVLNEVAPKTSAEFYTAAHDLIDFNEADAKATVAVAESAASQSNILMAAIIAISVLCSLIVGYLLAHSISKTLSRISATLANEADQLSETSHAIADASRSLSESTTEQAAALQQTTASLEETSAMIGKNADNAQRSTQVSTASQQSAQQGRETVEKMIRSINEISSSNDRIMAQIDTSNREIGDIVRVISDIGAKTKVINDIVFQTKLLSFNASVEAARAGEHGKGFAVVAEEVGNLAQMSGNAAKEISEMLASSISTVERIVENTKSRVGALVNEGKEKVSAGTFTAQQCGEMLQKIVNQVSDVGQMVSDISVASHEQARGVDEINKAMAQLDQSSQQNNASTQTVSSSAGDLRHEVEDLRGLVRELNATIVGTPAASHATAPKAAAAKPQHEPREPVTAVKLAPNVLKFRKPESAGNAVPDKDDLRFKDV